MRGVDTQGLVTRMHDQGASREITVGQHIGHAVGWARPEGRIPIGNAEAAVASRRHGGTPEPAAIRAVVFGVETCYN